MPVEDGVGYGELTPLKIEHFSRIMAMHMAITQAVIKKSRYFKRVYRYIDLTAGKGYTPNDLQGSPLVFLEQAESDFFQIPYHANFIESETQNIEELEANILKALLTNNLASRNIFLHQGNYEEIIPNLLTGTNKNELGLVFVDPSGDAPNFDTLKYIAQARPRMEILIYLSTTNIKRVHHLTDKFLRDYMEEIGKTHWLIRKPIPWDTHKWSFLLGSNTNIFKDYKKIDFLRLESEEAQQFFPKLNLSEKQRQQKIQPRLFD